MREPWASLAVLNQSLKQQLVAIGVAAVAVACVLHAPLLATHWALFLGPSSLQPFEDAVHVKVVAALAPNCARSGARV